MSQLYSYTPTSADANALVGAANQLGMDPKWLAGIVQFESGNNPSAYNSSNHVGLIQFGAAEQAQFGVSATSSYQDQANAIVSFFKARGWQPGMTQNQAYATVLGGNPYAGGVDSNGTSPASGVAAQNSASIQSKVSSFLGMATTGSTGTTGTPGATTAAGTGTTTGAATTGTSGAATASTGTGSWLGSVPVIGPAVQAAQTGASIVSFLTSSDGWARILAVGGGLVLALLGAAVLAQRVGAPVADAVAPELAVVKAAARVVRRRRAVAATP